MADKMIWFTFPMMITMMKQLDTQIKEPIDQNLINNRDE